MIFYYLILNRWTRFSKFLKFDKIISFKLAEKREYSLLFYLINYFHKHLSIINNEFKHLKKIIKCFLLIILFHINNRFEYI